MQENTISKHNFISSRNYGIDALRLFSMFLVVILHVLGQGGVLSLSKAPDKYVISWTLEIMAYCCVNIFAMISGYVSYSDKEKKYRYSRYISSWLQVFFYSFGITLLVYMMEPGLVDRNTLLSFMFPVTNYKYWYFTAYTGLFFVIPWLNRLVRSCGRQELNRLMLTIFVVFSCYVTFARIYVDVFRLGGGYSFLWIVTMYLVGAWMKKHAVSYQVSSSKAGALLLFSIMLTVLSLCFPGDFNKILVSYISPTVVLMAVAYVILFSKLHFSTAGEKLIRIFSPAAFGVYLIHVQYYVWNYVMKGRFAQIADGLAWMIPFKVIGSAAIVFVVCLLIEKVRLVLFRLLGVDKFAEKMEDVCRKWSEKWIEHIC